MTLAMYIFRDSFGYDMASNFIFLELCNYFHPLSGLTWIKSSQLRRVASLTLEASLRIRPHETK